MKMGKRIAVLLLAMVLVLPFVASAIPASAASGEMTRAEWISRVVDTFNMTVDDTSTMPDNYSSDLTTDNPYYQDILLAVEFGLIDIEAGYPFRPNDPATREFAAHTLNFALGFQFDESAGYTFSESSIVTYPNDIQVAINRGWFSLSGGSFMPEQPITASEADSMLADAAQVLAGDATGGGDNTVEFAEGVIVVPQGTEVIWDSESNTVTIIGYDGTIAAGDIFAVYFDDYPMTYKAIDTAENNDGSIAINVTRDGTQDAVLNFSYSGTAEADLEYFVPAETTTYYVRDTSKGASAPIQLFSVEPQGIDYDKGNKELTATHQVKLDGVNIGSVTVLLSNINVEHDDKYNIISTYAKLILDADVTVTASLTFDLSDYTGIPKSITIGQVGIESLLEASVSIDFDLTGGMSLAWEGDLRAGFEISDRLGDGELAAVRFIKDFYKRDFTFTANVAVQLGATIKVSADLWVFSGEVGASAGAKMYYDIYKHSEGTPTRCETLRGYLYANIFYSVNFHIFIDLYNDSGREDIFTESNSPARVYYHYEDGQLVSYCTRGEETGIDPDYEYYTSPDSPYFNPAPGYGQSYEDGSGTVVQIYSYEVEEDDAGQEYAVITGYNGGASALAIPSEIDGYEVREIKYDAFEDNELIRSVVVPDSVVSIGASAFEGCTSLSNVVLSKNLQELGYKVFGDCPLLYEIEIPKSLATANTITTGGPFGESGLKRVTFEAGTTEVVNNLFDNAKNLEEVQLLDTMTRIGFNAFQNCVSLHEIGIPNSVTEIASSAFDSCTSLTSVKIPDSVVSIGASAFEGCTSLSNVVLSKNLQELGYKVFGDCPLLYEIEIPKSLATANTITTGGPFGESGLKRVTFEAGTTEVVNNLFDNAKNLEEVQLLDTMTRIGFNAFQNCVSLHEIGIPNSVTEIASSAFDSCTSLTSVKIPDSVVSIGVSAFEGCTSLSNVVLSNSITEIPNDMFCNCGALTSVTLSEKLERIGARSFENCTSLTTISLPETVSYINSDAFIGSGLTEIEIPAACYHIGSSAFENCADLTSVLFNEGVKDIGSSCFRNCDSLTNIVIPNTVEEIGSYAFDGCEKLASVTFGNGIEEIPSNAFSNCPALNNVVIPYGVTEIGSSAFANCTGLTSITIPRTVTSIETNAFNYKDRLTIYGVSGTYAETFANNNGFKFVSQEHNATSVDLNVTELTLNCGQSYQLTYSVEPPNSTDEVFWRTTDSSVVSVTDSGLITAKAVGTATVLLNIGDNASAQCEVTVVQPVTSVYLNYSSRTMDVLDTLQLTASVRPDNAYNKGVTWMSSDSSVASVDDTGLVTAHKKGEATITVTAVDGSGKSDSCDITVNGNAAYSAEQLESSHNYANNSYELWVLRAEGATYIEVTFDAKTSLEQNMDFLYVYGSGEEPGDDNEYTGTELADKTVHVQGDTIKIRLVSDRVGNKWGFKVTDLKTDGKLDPYAEIRAELSSAAALDTDSAKLDAVRDIDTDLLAEAMAADDSQIAGQLAELESGMSLTADVIVTESMSAHFTEDDIAVTGAVMNVQNTGSPVTLTIDAPHDSGNYADSQYSSAVEFSMTLDNAIEPLEVPVMVTLPVPSGVDPDALVILHELSDGSVDRVEYTLSVENGQTFASFVVTELSDFTLAQVENDMFDAKLNGSTASVTVYGSSGSSIVCAAYDANGRMLSSSTRTLTASWQTLDFNVPSGAERVSFILLDSEYRPVMESIEA